MNRVIQMLGDLVGKEVAPELDELAQELEGRLGRSAIEDEKAGLLLLSVWAARRARGAMRPIDLRLEMRMLAFLEKHEWSGLVFVGGKSNPVASCPACLGIATRLTEFTPRGHGVDCEWASLLSELRARA